MRAAGEREIETAAGRGGRRSAPALRHRRPCLRRAAEDEEDATETEASVVRERTATGDRSRFVSDECPVLAAEVLDRGPLKAPRALWSLLGSL
jgi:hypothetical protein